MRRRDESGVILVWSAIVLVLLLGMAAFAVDVAFWHTTRNREQRAADAAALAGAVKYPGDPNAANGAALDVAGNNGYGAASIGVIQPDGSCPLVGNATIAICAGQGDKPDQYKVKVTQKVKNIFGGVLGAPTSTISTTATGEYLKALSMGSPSNQFGNDPDSLTSWPLPNQQQPPANYPNFWANIAGPSSTKANGDAYAADSCDGTTDGCSTSGFGNNLDYKSNGYYYTVDFTKSASVNLQAFDPAFVEVGDFCTDGTANLAGAAALKNVKFYPQGATNTTDIGKRYQPVTTQSNQQDPGYQYCTGDMLFGSGPAPDTTYTVLKATIPGDPSSAQAVPGCSIRFPGTSGDLAALLGTKNGYTAPGAPAPLAAYFRQWYTLCSVSGQAGDEYFIQVSTSSNQAAQGHNRFALRAVNQGGGSAAPVNIAGNAYMGIYANVGAQLTQFYLARVPSAGAGHTLALNFYDIGDASSPGTLTIVPPTDSNVGSSFSGCTWTGNSTTGATGFASNTPTAPWGTFTPISGCKITGVNQVGSWNAQWSTVKVNIPANYTCNDADPAGCWVKINYQFSGGVNDTTSWSATLLGDPVRLVK